MNSVSATTPIKTRGEILEEVIREQMDEYEKQSKFLQESGMFSEALEYSKRGTTLHKALVETGVRELKQPLRF